MDSAQEVQQHCAAAREQEAALTSQLATEQEQHTAKATALAADNAKLEVGCRLGPLIELLTAGSNAIGMLHPLTEF